MAAACEIDLRPFYSEQAVASQLFHNDPWRRTDDGWEHTSGWNVRKKPMAARIHPSVVAGLQVLVCLGGLLAADKTQQLD